MTNQQHQNIVLKKMKHLYLKKRSVYYMIVHKDLSSNSKQYQLKIAKIMIVLKSSVIKIYVFSYVLQENILKYVLLEIYYQILVQYSVTIILLRSLVQNLVLKMMRLLVLKNVQKRHVKKHKIIKLQYVPMMVMYMMIDVLLYKYKKLLLLEIALKIVKETSD